MKAIVITQPGPPDVLQLQNVADPEPGADDLLVRVRATAVNRADCLQRQGHYPAPPGTRQDIPGLEFAGEVESVGRNVRDWKRGDRVMGLLPGAGYAQLAVIHERLALPIPGTFTFEQAASIPEVFLTAFDALFLQLGLRMGERVLIHAVGSGVGTAALQLAKQAGAFVFGTARSPEKLEKARALGLDVAIDSTTQDFREIVLRETRDEGVHVILDVIGAEFLESNLSSLKPRGRMILVGLLSGRAAEANLGAILRKRLTLIGTALRSRALEEKAAVMQAFRDQVLPLFAAGRLHPVVDRVFLLEKAAEAHQYMEANLNFGKIILSMEDRLLSPC